MQKTFLRAYLVPIAVTFPPSREVMWFRKKLGNVFCIYFYEKGYNSPELLSALQNYYQHMANFSAFFISKCSWTKMHISGGPKFVYFTINKQFWGIRNLGLCSLLFSSNFPHCPHISQSSASFSTLEWHAVWITYTQGKDKCGPQLATFSSS